MKNITAPVYGFYAGNDARISATIPATATAMKAAGKSYDPVVYEGAGHGFMRAGQAPDASDANRKAYEEGFKKMNALIKSGGSAAATGLEKRAPERHSADMAATSTRAGAPMAGMDCHDDAHSTRGEIAVLINK